MSFRARQTARALTLLALGATAVHAQYSTPAGTEAAKPKTLRATAVLEWTGAIEKPNASRLIPLAVWDGEHYQPGALYLARPEPLALESGTQYELERSGDVIGLFDVRAAGEVNGLWEGLGRFQAEAPPPPPKKLKPSKVLPVLSNGKPDTGTTAANADSGRPTLHRKTDDSTPTTAGTSTAPATGPQTGGSSSPTSSASTTTSQTAPADSSKPAASTSSTSDSDAPALHRRTDSSASTTPPDTQTSTSSTTSSSTGSSGPTLHRHSDDSSSTDADADRPTLHKHSDAASADDDPGRPTLHRAKSGSEAAASIDPDRPRLRYGGSGEQGDTVLPTRLMGMPPNMQQVAAVSDSATGELRSYQYNWPGPGDAAKMQAALAAIAARAIVQPADTPAKPGAQFGPAAHARRTARKAKPAAPPAPALVDEHFAAYELTFSGGATLVYSAHTADEGPKRVWVTIIAQPDFNGVPQVLLQQVAHGDRLDETPWMQLIDAVDTDNDQRAELVFQLNGASIVPPADTPAAAPAPYDGPGDANAVAAANAANAAAAASRASAAASAGPLPEREFAIYRVAGGKAVQVFDTGPLP